MNLLIFSNAINFVGVALALWLGIFVLTRSPRRSLTRIAALLLWAVAGYQLGNLTYYNQLPENANTYWAALFRWSTFFAPALWLHFALTWLPPEVAHTRWKFALGAYGIAILFTVLDTFAPLFIADYDLNAPLVGASRDPNNLFPLFIAYLLACIGATVFNLRQAQRHTSVGSTLSRHVQWVIIGSALATMAAIYLTVIIQLQLEWPNMLGDVLLTASLILIGYAVAMESARLDGRSVQRDFLYSLLVIGCVCAAYLVATLLSYLIYGIPFVTFILVLMLAVVSHSIYDWARATFDRFFFQRPTRELRENLRALAHEAGSEEELPLTLRQLFTTLCQMIEPSRGALLIRQPEGYLADTAHRIASPTPILPTAELIAHELGAAPRPSPLGELALLAPLRVMGQPMAALALGPKESGGPYSLDDEDVIADVTDRMEKVLALMSLHAERTRKLNEQVAAYRAGEREVQATIAQQAEALQAETAQEAKETKEAISVTGFSEKEFVGAVEDVLRHLNDIPYLSEQRLATLRGVTRRLDATTLTNLDKGKALKEWMSEALDKLRPASGSEPKQPGNEWYPYLILRDAYVMGVPNREIMARYYISEGTFNRTRRRAIRAVAKAIAEVEMSGQA